MTKLDLPSPEILRKLLRYEPDTGKLFWRRRDLSFFANSKRPKNSCSAWNARFSNKEALTANKKGYKVGSIFDKNAISHVVAWALFYGEIPDLEIDHKNKNRSDNRIKNLRIVTPKENRRNMKKRSDNKSGFSGVHFCKITNKWVSQISGLEKRHYLGSFHKKEDAISAVVMKRKEFGYHENHGGDE